MQAQPDPGPLQQSERALMGLLGLVAVYALAHLFWYWGTPLGRTPVLDGAEIVGLARQLHEGTLEQGPFYRQVLYPWILSGYFALGGAPGHIMYAVGLLGLACHLVSVVCVHRLGLRIWGRREAALLGALLYGLYPVALFFLADPLDITLGIMWFLLAMVLFSPPGAPRWRTRMALSGACMGLAVLTRPHFLAVAPAWAASPLLVYARVSRKRAVLGAAVLAGMMAVVLLAQGVVQVVRSSEFRIMPWQGAFALWMCNRPGADGRYYEQTVDFGASGAVGVNPARLESTFLYEKATGRADPSVDEITRFWRSRFLQDLRTHPRAWLGLMARKVYYLFNNWEPYGIKTYAFHKSRSPVLRWNPLGWGVLLVLAAAILSLARPARFAAAPAAAAVFYAMGTVVFQVIARYRLPLVPLLCVAAGGAAVIPWRTMAPQTPGRAYRWAAVAALVAVLLSFSTFFHALDPSTMVNDRILMAHAAIRDGNDAEALGWSAAALAAAPNRQDANLLAATSFYNLQLTRSFDAAEFPGVTWQTAGEWLGRLKDPGEQARFMLGVVDWKCGERDSAVARWREVARTSTPFRDEALGALLVVGEQNDHETALARSLIRATTSPFLCAGLGLSDPALTPVLEARLGPDQVRVMIEYVAGLMGMERD